MEEQTNSTTNKKSQTGPLIGIIGIIVIVVVAIVGYQSMNKTQTQTANTTTQTTTQSTPAAETTDTASASSFKDGNYTAVGTYSSPGGQEELGVTLTVANGIVTDSTVTVKATNPESKERQQDFAANYKTQVVGKSLADLKVSKVSGSSLSPIGFNAAVEKIKTEAKA